MIFSHVLYQLSYLGTEVTAWRDCQYNMQIAAGQEQVRHAAHHAGAPLHACFARGATSIHVVDDFSGMTDASRSVANAPIGA